MDELVNEAARRLLSLAASGAGAQEMIEAAYDYFQKPVVLLDEIFRVVAFYGPGVVPEDCERKNDGDPVQRREWHRRVESSEEPVIDDQGGGPYRAMCLDVHYAGMAVAKLTVMETTPFTPRDAELLKLLSDVMAVHFVGSHGDLTTTRDRERSALLRALLRGEQPMSELRGLMRFLSIPEDHAIRLMAFRPATDTAADDHRLRSELLKLFDAITAEVDDCFLCLTGEEEYADNREAIGALADTLSLRCGVSRSFDDLAEVKDYQHQALAALRIGIRSGAPLTEYDRCVADDLIGLCRADRSLRSFCRPEILTLARYDRENGTDLLQTLACYLDSLCNMAETARRTYLHYNTVKYRLKLIGEIAGIREIGADDLCEYRLSLRMLKELG